MVVTTAWMIPRRRATQPYGTFLSLLATLYLALGSHAVHHAFHNRPVCSLEEEHLSRKHHNCSHTACCQQQNDSDNVSLSSAVQLSSHHQCPICSYLATCSFLPPAGDKPLFLPDGRACLLMYSQALPPHPHQISWPIRGPPMG